MENPPKISVIIPAYNAARWITGAIDSALSQTLAPYEIIVVNDGSTDDTQNILAKYVEAQRAVPVRIIEQENAGVSAARNAAMEAASGDWLAFLDADDRWLPEKLEKVMSHSAIYPGPALFSHDVYVIDERDKLVNAYRFKVESSENMAGKLIQGNWIITSSTVIKREVALETGKFRPDIKRGEDWHLWLRVAMKHRLEHIREPLALYRRMPGSAIRSDMDESLADAIEIINDIAAQMESSDDDIRHAKAAAYRESAVRRMAAFDGAGVRRDLARARTLDGWSARDAALWSASLLPAPVRRVLLYIKRSRDALVARRHLRLFSNIGAVGARCIVPLQTNNDLDPD